ncbi:MAG TPA: aspartyl protease family protein [Holophagaceae bacterium]
MHRMGRLLLRGLALAMLVVPLHADPRPKGPTTPLEINELGQVIVKVRLSARKPGIPDRDFRFILDTGASSCVVDASVPTDFFWEEPVDSSGATEALDATQQKIATRFVSLKRLAIGGMVREDLLALRMDLKGTMLGHLQDEPVDGLLGMNFLHGTRFVLDPARRELRWWQELPGWRLPLAMSGSPYLTVKVGKTDVPCMLDTGASGGFQMPGSASPSEHPKPFLFAGASGQIVQGETIQMDQLTAGGKGWPKVPLDLVKPGEGSATLGQDVLFAAPLGLDFIGETLTFTLDAQGHLPYHRSPRRAPLIWDRRPNGSGLRVWAVAPGSRWAKAGLQQGDEVLAIGPLAGKALTMRAAQRLSGQETPLPWRIRRQGTECRVEVPAPAESAR